MKKLELGCAKLHEKGCTEKKPPTPCDGILVETAGERGHF